MDRIPPHAPEAEKAIIGCCLNTPKESIPAVQEFFPTLDVFYEERNRKAMEAIYGMEPDKVDYITVNMESGLPATYLTECQEAAFSSANLPEWIRLVQGRYTVRQIIKTCSEIVVEAYSDVDSERLLEQAESRILKIRPKQVQQSDIKGLLAEATKLIETKAMNWDTITGLSTGLKDLDSLTDGLHKSELVVIAAMPSCGKTALAVNIAVHNGLEGSPVGILSAEMRPVQLLVRSLCSENRVNFRELTEQDCRRLVPSMAKFSKSPIHIESVSGYTIGQVQAAARRMKQRHDIKILVVDYIQLIGGVGDNREQQVASIGRGLKLVASELDIPVIALSQLNDDGKLRESRAIGQDADSVWVLANDGEWQPKVQPVKLRVEKCRDGETGKVDLTFLKTFTRFECVQKVSNEDVPNGHND